MSRTRELTKIPPSGAVHVLDAPHAPILYFDGATNFGHVNGVINVTLAANRYLGHPDGVQTDVVAVTHLRCNLSAANGLIEALQKALILASPTTENPN